MIVIRSFEQDAIRHSTLFRAMVSNEIKTEMDGFYILSFLTVRVNHLWLLL